MKCHFGLKWIKDNVSIIQKPVSRFRANQQTGFCIMRATIKELLSVNNKETRTTLIASFSYHHCYEITSFLSHYPVVVLLRLNFTRPLEELLICTLSWCNFTLFLLGVLWFYVLWRVGWGGVGGGLGEGFPCLESVTHLLQ